eukprot:TRINITY_DN3499_c0_g1_i1.p1 TRINITY_DN3499_c0_g1~~TRINITY_DN3499_c0_g1_i1.p1  ORF type:complete len:493 (+),score=176.23 TRINITY_DN3499_c0_g1_i1:25-1503(+)
MSLLERIRACHEDIERIENQMVESLIEDPKTHKETIDQTHYVDQMIDLIMKRKEDLMKLYEDAEGMLKEEIESLTIDKEEDYEEKFYSKLKDITSYHAKYNVDIEIPQDRDYLPNKKKVNFTGEEKYGRYLDLHHFHDIFINLAINRYTNNDEKNKNGEEEDNNNNNIYAMDFEAIENEQPKIEYVKYLQNFYKFKPFTKKKDKEYKKYLMELLEYLLDFLKRSQPLYDLSSAMNSIIEDFQRQWDDNTIRSWKDLNEDDKDEDIQNDPLFCQACNKLFKNANSFKYHLNGKKHKKAMVFFEKYQKEIFFLEYKINRIGQILGDQVESTRINVEKKHAQTIDIIIADIEEDELGDLDIDEDDDYHRMTIPNYPVGWDGKPIPFWLYKLHGLGVEFKCEICGNTSYWGRRAFERHFQEWRHAHGMKILGIPNTTEFHEITNVELAINLWNKIKEEKKQQTWNPDEDEEYEDGKGNIINKKIYNDLKRQGLLKE